MLLLLLGNVTVLAPAIFIFSDEYRHHGQAWFQDQMYYLGSRWIHGGEGQSAAIFSVYQCEWVVAGCTVLHTEYYPVEAGGYRIMSASLTEYGDTLTARINDHTFFKLAS